MIDHSITQQPSQQPQPYPAALARLVERCDALLQRMLPPLLDAALQRVDDALYDLADKAESDKLCTGYFEALKLVRRERANLKRRYLRTISDTAAQFLDAVQAMQTAGESTVGADASPTDSPWADIDGLALVRDNDLEESLVLSNMISKAENRYALPLRNLSQHFATLAGRPALGPLEAPISPTALCTAFRTAVKSLPDLELSTLLVVYKVFDKQVMDNLDDLYAACSAFAVSQGMDPKGGKRLILNDGTRNRAGFEIGGDTGAAARPAAGDGIEPGAAALTQPVHQPAPPDSPGDRREPAPAATGADDIGLGAAPGSGPSGRIALDTPRPGVPVPAAPRQPGFEQLRVLLRGQRGRVETLGEAVVVGTEELMAALSRLQHRLEPETDSTLTPSDLRHSVVGELDIADQTAEPGAVLPTTAGQVAAEQAASATERRLTRTDEDTMDLVFLLFEQVLAAPDIPDSIKAVVSRLQIPYVKIALIDRRFFDDPDHAARRLINRIARAALGWNDDGDRDPDSLYGRINTVVERMITEFHTDPRLLETLDADLGRYLGDQERQARLAELRTVRSIGARDERHAVRRKVMRVIDERLRAQGEIPVVVAAIIYDGWAEVMLKVYLRDGENSQPWRHAIKVLDRLVWSIRPKRDPAERRELLRRIPELLRDLRTAMAGVVSDPQLLGRWLKELQVVHISVLRGVPDDPESGAASGASAEPAPAADPPRDSVIDLDRLPVGTWLRIMRDDDQWLRVKLAWRSEDGDELLFVDRLGQKGFEMTRVELQILFEQGLAEVIGDGSVPLVDRALDAMRRSLTLH